MLELPGYVVYSKFDTHITNPKRYAQSVQPSRLASYKDIATWRE